LLRCVAPKAFYRLLAKQEGDKKPPALRSEAKKEGGFAYLGVA
jgi:hypothetical protein